MDGPRGPEAPGNPGAAARAVFTLLGTDLRFQVDARARGGSTPRSRLRDPPSAPSTSRSWTWKRPGAGIGRGTGSPTSPWSRWIAGVVGEPFSTLVHPGRSIPWRIQSLTGITDEMVASAPPLRRGGRDDLRRPRRTVFTAHNVQFDWGFVEGHLLDCRGRGPPRPPALHGEDGACPGTGLGSYALDSASPATSHRHRGTPPALGDALATARVLVHLLDAAEREGASGSRAASTGSGQRAGEPGAGTPPPLRAPPAPHPSRHLKLTEPPGEPTDRSPPEPGRPMEPESSPSLAVSRRIGDLRIHALDAGLQRLDGGAMFGVVPKPLWERRIPADEKNRIPWGSGVSWSRHPRRSC
jgi:DNA polymerase III epsilon subunit-like protein